MPGQDGVRPPAYTSLATQRPRGPEPRPARSESESDNDSGPETRRASAASDRFDRDFLVKVEDIELDHQDRKPAPMTSSTGGRGRKVKQDPDEDEKKAKGTLSGVKKFFKQNYKVC